MPISGASELIAQFSKLSTQLQDQIKDAVEETTLKIQEEAIHKAPAAGDPLATTYGFQKNNTGINQYIFSAFDPIDKGYSGQVFVDAGATALAAYIEFGTGSSAAEYVPTLPIEWQAIAASYYINGRGTLIKQPFLLPAFFEQSPKLITKIVKILKTAKL